MSCLDVMYQVYGPPPQPYFAAAYHHQKLAFYSKMQEAQESVSGCSFSNAPGTTIKEEDCAREKDPPREAEYLSSRCVLFTYFHGDISSVVDEHFSRALSQPSSYVPGSGGSKSGRDVSFPMSQRCFPASFWNSAYQPSSAPPSSLSSALGSPHPDLPFPGDHYSSAASSLHSHLHQPGPEAWHPSHHHHHHHHPYSLAAQASAYPRAPSMHDVYGTHFNPRYGSLLVPSVPRPHRLPPAPGPPPTGPSGSPCDLGKSEAAGAGGAGWTAGPFSGAGQEIGQSLGLNMDAGLQSQDKSKDLYWF